MNEIQKQTADLSTPIEELQYKLLYETDIEEMKNIINLFNLNIQKKNIVRTGKISDVQDKLVEQIEKRVTLKPDELTTTDLNALFKTMQDALAKADTTLEKVDTPSIQINENQININMTDESQLSQASKLRVLEFVRKAIQESQAAADVLNKGESDIITTDYTEIKQKEE